MYCRSSFNGIIDEIPHISVDNFTNTSKRVYFLSHCHTDHTEGFKQLIKDDVCVYTSEINVKIMEHEIGAIASYMRPLKLGYPETITLPANIDENLEEMYVKVTLIAAAHCLGSTMILFETNNKTILYTGDFRLSSNDISKFRDFHKPPDYKTPIHIDVMYIDTTFLYDYEDFPKRSESIGYLVREIKTWLQEENNKVAIRTPAKYGYEHVFSEIYKNLGKKVYVGDRKWELYSQLKVSGVTKDRQDIDIHNCPGSFRANKQHSKCIPIYTEKYNFLYVNLSAMRWNTYNPDDIPLDREKNNNLHICFATHCSRTELKYFINYFSPKKIVGFPNVYVTTPTKPVEKIVFSPVKKIKCNRKRKVPLNI